MSKTPQYLVLVAALVAVACSDNTVSSPSPRALEPGQSAAVYRALGSDEHFGSMGTSISAGWCSNGFYEGCQTSAWPSLLDFGNSEPMTLPLIQSPGCTSPLIAPLGANARVSGETFAGSAVCAPNVAGVTLPTQNVALPTAIAADAVQKTPQIAGASLPFYSRVLAPGMTQLAALLSQPVTIASVEFGGNEVLGATSGLYLPGVTVVPLQFFIQPYTAILNALSVAQKKVVLVSLLSDARNVPALRRATEVWANRDEFARLNVTVSADCENSPNYINVSTKSIAMAFAGAAAKATGQPAPVYSCADVPGTPDAVLTPADIAAANTLIAQMNDFITQQAEARGFALFSLSVLYERNEGKQPYSVVAQLTSSAPYGNEISLDGIHPSAFGHQLLAHAAAKAIRETYGKGQPNRVRVRSGELSLADRLVEPTVPAFALEQALRLTKQNANAKVPVCFVPGAC
jgi:lysophospholipase L1-like esterase